MADEVIRLDQITKIYPLLSGDVVALDNVSLSIQNGEFVAIIGPSGSGKSTLLNQLGCLDVPTSGDIFIGGKSITRMNDYELTRLRLMTIGFIFQKFNLLPLLSAYENVEYPYTLKYRKKDTTGRVSKLLSLVGIHEDLARHKPNELSGGQQQRVAIARALVNNPKILLCDEPTGNLDSKTGILVMSILKRLNKKGKTLIIVTHDPAIAAQADRIITIRDGRIAEDGS
ncbi:MAG TPA: ABC transporter ATP-binding protein [Methanospirillum sp.]|uniref:ABC transporter ATP-binding protein n=1 Tax=Methanospirillum sp. TaxID=45200 RepID=UPI002C625F1E|nr:ABC transporter ATP-binding protein [Methanospirillum sp.]HOJ97672.1 ABC transporter ATP-binding protein [Methanospirillum sp.]HOL41695.1 ABC transporter ATP-binding protein [Methanospirillum sp.]HPP77821.1 ABC transporter ATP-binding protein [Methanospirillum sp.]